MTYSRTFFLVALITAVMVSKVTFGATLSLQEANATFSRGNAAYQAQKYEDAEAAYKELITAGYASAPVLYNLGTTAARLGKSGEALGYLMRAQTQDPRDENIAANLQRVKVEHAKKAGLDEDAVIAATRVNVWNKTVGFFTADEWLFILWISVMLSSIGGAILMVSRAHRIRILGKIFTGIGLGAIALFIIPGVAQFYRTRFQKKAIVVKAEEMLSGPAERFTRVAQLQEGQLVKGIGTEKDGFQPVRLDNGLQGYVNKEALMNL